MDMCSILGSPLHVLLYESHPYFAGLPGERWPSSRSPWVVSMFREATLNGILANKGPMDYCLQLYAMVKWRCMLIANFFQPYIYLSPMVVVAKFSSFSLLSNFFDMKPTLRPSMLNSII